MNAALRACILGTVVLAVPASCRADGWPLPPVKVDCGAKAWFNVHVLDWSQCATLGPWYLYYPYQAHFQTPPPIGPYPNWPSPMLPPPAYGPRPVVPGLSAPGAPSVPQMPPAAPVQGPGGQDAQGPPLSYLQPRQQPTMQPVGYFYNPVPAYWYGR
jgi:hypothetical protein